MSQSLEALRPRFFQGADLGAPLDAFAAAKRDHASDVTATVTAILEDMKTRGDAALFDYTRRFDGFDPNEEGVALGAEALEQALDLIPETVREALAFAAERIAAFHARQLPGDLRFTDAADVELGSRWTPVRAAGLYVPGGKAAYPSSVLMNAIPARVAGVERVVMTVPAPGGTIAPVVLAAAHLAGVREVYKVGGAQAVGALAFGTQTIAPVAKIVGPGNAYVNTAKRLVYGQVGIDLLAGPSEIVVMADAANNPDWIAIDLLSQAEHDEAARSVLITDNADFAEAVIGSVRNHLATLERREIASASWRDHGAVVLVPDWAAGCDVANRLAAEHLQIATEDPDQLLGQIREAGAVFLGRHTPEAIGDYVAGTNHVLPTGGSARFASGLSVLDFMKRTSVVRCSEAGLRAIGPAAVTLADAEGLGAHARSVSIRLGQ